MKSLPQADKLQNQFMEICEVLNAQLPSQMEKQDLSSGNKTEETVQNGEEKVSQPSGELIGLEGCVDVSNVLSCYNNPI